MENLKKLLLLPALLLFLNGCSGGEKPRGDQAAGTPEQLYESGNSALEKGEYNRAIRDFEAIEREHPASSIASYASVKKAYVLYLDDKFDDAIFVIEDFIKQYPSSKAIPYMYYLKALCYYDQIVDIGRDQHVTMLAYDALSEVITRFPNSQYANDAKLKMDLAFNHLAGKEMEIGLFYLHRNELVAALNRFRTVVERYDTSIFIQEALYRMAEIYYSLGVIDQAKAYSAVLAYNYPDSKWSKMANNVVSGATEGSKKSITERVIEKIW